MTQILRLTQSPPSLGKYNIRIELQRDGESAQSTDVSFEFNLSHQDQERLRWYFEDYLQYPQDPAPSIAAQVEGQLTKIGIELFRKIFQTNFDAHKIWSYALPQLNNTRIEIVTDVQEATAIPWELICNPDTLQPLALSAASFVRTYSQAAVPPKFKKTSTGPIRILLAICRPAEDNDVPFRSVASQVISGLLKEGGTRFQLDLLRPPTFDQLGRVLRKAKDEGKPYHVLHFDGHGTYADLGKSRGLGGVNRNTFASQRPGPCGYLLFENPHQEENMELVDGTRLGNLLREAEVPILVLNACRSAYAQSPNEPASAEDEKQIDAHLRVRAFGSLAQEVMHAGLSGVVAMRYVVYVVTAAQFVAELYDALAQGWTLEEAVNLGRKHLHDQPKREIAFRERELLDWSVPVVFEAGTLALFPRQTGEKKFEIKIRENEAIPERGSLDSSLPPSPDTGFFGRDETLLAIDRAFDSHKIVLLHAYAGSGKTATAAEFARWYSLTGGVDGPVLFTSFERHMPLSHVMDKIGQAFGKILEEQGIHWLTLDDKKRKHVALDVLKQMPVLWIWDNVEPVAGFPTGTKSAWSTEEQQDLANFLRAARDTKAKFLLTSRREEREWLGDLPRKIPVPPMPMFERMELARAIADKRGQRMVDVESWRPLLRYTEGNPLTITILVGQVLREGLGTKEQIEQFVDQLRSGEKEIEDDESQDRSRSLGASLRYGSQSAFDEKERRILALLSFFQGFVNVGALMQMGQQGQFSLVELQELKHDDGMKLLDRAAEVGMLTALGGGCYRIHPALPWFFRGLFQKHYKGREDEAARAFEGAMGALGEYCFSQCEAGHPEVVSFLAIQEANLLYARQLALKEGWWSPVLSAMQGLLQLYDQIGLWMEWKRLVEEIVPFFVDLKTDGPISGREKEWGLVTEYRVKLAIRSRQWDDALSLQKKSIEWHREYAGPALAADSHKIEKGGRIAIRNYIVSIGDLAEIQREMGDAGCVLSYKEAIEKSEKYGFGPDAARGSITLGNAYLTLAQIRDLDQAELLIRHGLDLTAASDELGRGRCLIPLGHVALERFYDSEKAGKPEVKHLEAALEFYQQAMDVIPPNAANELSHVHMGLGNAYRYAGMFDKALRHFQVAINYADKLGDIYLSAQCRRNAAFDLVNAGQLADAMEYARSALEKFEACGPAGAKKAQEIQKLIELEKALRSE